MTRLRDARDEGGFTLIELLMVIILLAVMGSVTFAGIAQAMKTTRQDSTRGFNASTLESELQRISREVRVADPVRKVSTNDLVVDVFRDGGCRRVEWKMSGTNLQRRTLTWTSTTGCAAYPSTVTAASDTGFKTVLRKITSATPFSFLDAAGATLTTPTTGTTKQVVVTLVQSQPENRAALTVTASAYLRNAT